MNNFQELYDKACDVAWSAGHDAVPAPVTWKDEQTGKVYEPCDEGLCGFAWINIKPSNCTFAKWLVFEKLARSDRYYGGVTIWVSEFNQSYERKLAYANAFAQYLKAECLINPWLKNVRVSVGDRLD